MENTYRQQVLERLEKEQIPFEYHQHPPVSSMEECLALPFITEDVVYVKNILLCNRQKTDFYLYLSMPLRAFRTADISRKLQVSRLSFAPDSALHDFLHLSSGSLSPLSLWWDSEKRITLVMDRDLHNAARLAFHPCDNTGTLIFTGETFFSRVLPSLHCICVDVHAGE